MADEYKHSVAVKSITRQTSAGPPLLQEKQGEIHNIKLSYSQYFDFTS